MVSPTHKNLMQIKLGRKIKEAKALSRLRIQVNTQTTTCSISTAHNDTPSITMTWLPIKMQWTKRTQFSFLIWNNKNLTKKWVKQLHWRYLTRNKTMIPKRQETYDTSHKSAQLTALGEFSGRGTGRRNPDRACGFPKLRKWSWESKEAKVARVHKGDQQWVESWREREKWRNLQRLILELLVENHISTYM